MNKPKAMPKCSQLSGSSFVSNGSNRLPGASVFVRPSMKMTETRHSVERIPANDV
jgi:hypothetical protein